MAEKFFSIINVNTNKKISFCTQGQQLAARVLFTLWLLASSSPEGVFAVPGRHPATALEKLISRADVLDNHTFGQALHAATLQLDLPSDVSPKTVLTNLRAIALTLLGQGTGQISDEQVRAIEESPFSPEMLVETGLLQATDSGKYQFAHRRIQAYLAGCALAEKLLSQDEHEQSSVRILLSKDKYNPQYRTALSFMAREVSMVKGMKGIEQVLRLLGEDKEVVGLQHLLLQLRVLHEWLCIATPEARKGVPALDNEFKVISSLQEWFCAGLEQVRLWGYGPASPGVRILDLLTDSLQVSSSVLHHNSGLLSLLHKAPKDRDSKVRQAVLRTLEQFIVMIPQTSKDILPILQEAAESQNSNVRQAAVKALGKAISVVSQKKAILRTLLRATKDPHLEVRQVAFEALGKAISVVPQKEAILRTLYNVTIKTRYCSVLQAAFEALIEAILAVPEASENILETLCKNTKDQDFSLRKTAVKALGKVISSIPQEEAILEILLSATNDLRFEVRQAAFKALGKVISVFPQASEAILNALRKAAKYDRHNARQAAIEALGEAILGCPEAFKDILDTLRQVTKIPDCKARQAAVKVLEKAISAAPQELLRSIRSILCTAARDNRHLVRQEAVAVLGRVISSFPQAFEAILDILRTAAKDNRYLVRQEAVAALGRVISVAPQELMEAILKTLYKAASHQDWNVREAAVAALGKAISDDPQELMEAILETLRTAAQDEGYLVREAAVAALGKAISVAPQELMEAILETLRTATQDKEYFVRQAAVKALGKAISVVSQKKAILQTLHTATQDQNGYVREASVQALGKFNRLDTKSLTILIKFTKDQDKNIYQAAAQALAKFPTEQYIDRYWVTKDPQLVFYIAYRLHETSLVITQSQATLYPAEGKCRIWQKPTKDLERLARLIKYEIDPVKQGVKYQADKGPEYYRQCLQRAQAFQLGNHPDLVLMLQNLSAAYHNSGKTTYAIQYHQQAAKLLQQLEGPAEAKS